MTAMLRVGCPMWAHGPWVGTYLSAGNRGNELAEYAGWCNAVEGNTTFYATPSQRTVERWTDQAPPDFRFAFKLPRTVTHELRLHGPAAAVTAEFLRAIEPLGERIGPLQIQLPPSFGPDQLSALRSFATQLPHGWRWVIELRHAAFFDGGPAHRAVDDILANAGIGRVVLDTRPLYASSPRTDAAVDERRTKPRLPVVTDLVGEHPVIRVIGADDPDETFEGIDVWRHQVIAWIAGGRTPYVFVHQPENLHSPALARRFHAAVAAEVPELRPLPEPPPGRPGRRGHRAVEPVLTLGCERDGPTLDTPPGPTLLTWSRRDRGGASTSATSSSTTTRGPPAPSTSGCWRSSCSASCSS